MTNKPGTKSAEQLRNESREKAFYEDLLRTNYSKSMGIGILVVAAIVAVILLIAGVGFVPALIALVSGGLSSLVFFAISEMVERQNTIISLLIDLKLK